MANLPEPIKEVEDEEQKNHVSPPPCQEQTIRTKRLQSTRRASVAVFTSNVSKSTNQRSPEAEGHQQSPLASKPKVIGRRMSVAAQPPRRRGSVVVSDSRRASVTWNMTSQMAGSLTPRFERNRRQSVAQTEKRFQPIIKRKKSRL